MDGGLPYTVDLGDPRALDDTSSLAGALSMDAWVVAETMHQVEKRLFVLRQGEAVLEWADALYRSDEPSSIQRSASSEVLRSASRFDSNLVTNPGWGGRSVCRSAPRTRRARLRSSGQLGILQIEAGRTGMAER